MQTVHVRVNDSVTGKPTACRVRFTDAAGKYYPPLGRRADFPHLPSGEGNVGDDSQAWAYIDGACEIQLPPGSISVAIRKGIEYSPLNTVVELLPGKLAMRFTLERWTNWRKSGWYSGDGRVQNHTPHDVLLQASGEDLAVVNLLTEEYQGGDMPNIVAFSGQKPCLETPGHMVVVNTCNVYPRWGSLSLLNCHRVVYPLRLGKEGEDEWTLADWCDQCHRKQGLVVWACHGIQKFRFPGPLAELTLRKIDAFELTELDDAALERESPASWETLLDAGFRVPLVGSSGSHYGGRPLGRPRTYCQLPAGEELNYRNWIEAVRAGRSFVTEGPLIRFTVDGFDPGSAIELLGQRQTVAVHVEVESALPFTLLEIVCNGQLVGQGESSQTSFPWKAQITQEVSTPDGGWITANCRGGDGRLLARTSPVYVNVAGRLPSKRQEAQRTLAGILTTLLDRARKESPMNQRLVHVLEKAVEYNISPEHM